MSVDQYSLVRGVAQDAVFGLRSKRGTIADLVCEKRVETSTQGSVPYYPTLHQIADVNDNTLQNPLGILPREESFAMGTTRYDMGRWDAMIPVDKAVLKDIEKFAKGSEPLMQQVMAKVDMKVDRTLNKVLVDTNVNLSQSVGASYWSLTNSTPSADILNAYNKTPGANLCVCGLDVAQNLAKHPEFKESTSNYAGTGFSSFAQVRSYISELTGIPPEQVFVAEAFFNSANKGQTLALAYAFSKTFWIGHKQGLLLIEQDYSDTVGDERPTNEGLVTVEENHNLIEFAYGRVGQIKRAGDKELGCVIPGVLA